MIPAKGYAAKNAKTPLVPFSFERRDLRSRDIAIDIKFCGICHSDVHQARNEWGQSTYPMVPGHEIAGIVTRVGGEVTKFKAGDKAGVGCFVDSCRQCENCREGLEQYCTGSIAFTYNSHEKDGTPTFGGYSDKIVVHEDYVLRMPENIPLDKAAPLLCAGITLYSPLRHWNAGPGKRVGIIGLGGLGHMGVKIAHALQAEVSVISHSLKKKEDAKRLGAAHFYATPDPETFKKLQGHFDLLINTVPTHTDFNQFITLLRRDGALVAVGVPDKEIPLAVLPLIFSRKSVSGSLIGGIRETQEMLDFCGKHNLGCDIEVIPAQKINEAYERITKIDVRYRFVIDMSTL